MSQPTVCIQLGELSFLWGLNLSVLADFQRVLRHIPWKVKNREFQYVDMSGGILQGGNQPADVSYRKVPSPDYPQNNHYPLFIHLSIINPSFFYLSIHYPVIHGYLEFSITGRIQMWKALHDINSSHPSYPQFIPHISGTISYPYCYPRLSDNTLLKIWCKQHFLFRTCVPTVLCPLAAWERQIELDQFFMELRHFPTRLSTILH